MNSQLPISPLVTLRLTDDAMHLEGLFGREASMGAPGQLTRALQAEAARLGMAYAPTDDEVLDVQARLVPGAWMTLRQGRFATPSTPGRVEVLVPIPISGPGPGQLPRKCMVRVGTVLARKSPAWPGVPGQDLLGRAVAPRVPAAARLPQGTNTEVSEDGRELLAVCDGEVVLRNLLIEILPVMLHLGDIASGTTQIAETVPVYVRGSVLEGALVAAQGEVFVEGNVVEAHVLSSTSRVTVGGTVGGSRQRASVLRAAGDVVFDQARLAHIHAGRNIHILTRAWQSSLHARGDIYLNGHLDECLQEVVVDIAGGIFPHEASPALEPGLDRESVRVGCTLRAELAIHGPPPLRFRNATIVDISGSGARVAFTGAPASDLPPGTAVQVKFLLPESHGQVIAIGQIVRAMPGGSVGVTLQQITARDQSRIITYCQQLALKRATSTQSSRDQRGKR